MSSLEEATPVASRSSFEAVRAMTERLAQPLSAEDQTVQSMADTSPTKWHRGHTTWFFETFVLPKHAAQYEIYDDQFAFLFNSYYEAVGPRHQRAQRGVITRPGIDEVQTYRHHVDEAMGELLELESPPEVRALVELGLHHEQQHQELLLMDIKHVLSQNPTLPRYHAPRARHESTLRPTRWLRHDAGVVEVGFGGDSFSFDNERPRHETYVPAFEIADRPVTCGDYLDFVAAGGYDRAEFWLSDGWATVHSEGWRAPLYWTNRDGEWRVFTLGGERDVIAAEPVCHLSYYEADAFARYAGARLPTEAEWEIAQPSVGDHHTYDPGDVHPHDVTDGGGVGQVWEWTASAYLPYPGFRIADGAVGEYNGKFMVNQYVLRGGSVATPPGHVRPTYRNFFPSAARWPFTGLRLARDLEVAGAR